MTQYTYEVCSSYLKSLLIELILLHEITDHKTSLSYFTYKQCKDYIDKNFARIKNTGEVAEHCCLSPQYMGRLFVEHCNMSPHEYLMRVKLNTSANLLVTSTLSVTQIAQRIGFDDPFYFSSCFKKKVGVSPTKYRSKYMDFAKESS